MDRNKVEEATSDISPVISRMDVNVTDNLHGSKNDGEAVSDRSNMVYDLVDNLSMQ